MSAYTTVFDGDDNIFVSKLKEFSGNDEITVTLQDSWDERARAQDERVQDKLWNDYLAKEVLSLPDYGVSEDESDTIHPPLSKRRKFVR